MVVMKLIEEPKKLAEHIVNAVVTDIYGRAGGDWFFDGIDKDVLRDELTPELVAVVQRVLDQQHNVT
jgi:flagellar motor component MotA